MQSSEHPFPERPAGTRIMRLATLTDHNSVLASISTSEQRASLGAVYNSDGGFVSSAFTRMAHEIAKLLLEHAGTFVERTEAVDIAISLGMPLNEIEEYLDWLDVTRGPPTQNGEQPAGDG